MKNQNAVKEISLICNEPNKLYAKYKHPVATSTQTESYSAPASCDGGGSSSSCD